MSCRICRRDGHNRASCPARPEDERAAERAGKRYFRRPVDELLDALTKAGGNQARAAALLQISHARVGQLIRKHELLERVRALKLAARPTPAQRRERQRAANTVGRRRLVEKRRRLGLCVRCGRRCHASFASCARCRGRRRKSEAAYRKSREARGLCQRCGRRARPGRVTCRRCTKYRVELGRRSAEGKGS